MSLLGVDVGTTGTKAVAFNLEGEAIASAYREYPLLSPRPGWLELDARKVRDAVLDVVREVASKTKHDPIRALSVSCQGEAAVPVSKDGEVLYNTPISFDSRTDELARRWAEKMSREEVFGTTGMPLHPMHTIFKILWIREHEPDVFRRAWKFLCYEEYVFYLLGLEPTTDYSLAARTMAFDVRKKAWSDRMLDVAGLPEDIFPKVVPSGTVVGEVPRKRAEELGLPEGVLAVTGGHDQPCNALGSGVVREKVAAYGVGTVECITPTFAEVPHPERLLSHNFACYPHVAPGLLVTLAFNFTGGSLLRWYRDNFGEKEREEAGRLGTDPYDLILSDLPEGPTGLLVLPHFTATGTPHFDVRSKGVVLGLTLSTSRKEFIKALLEGVTMEMRLNLELLEEAGVQVRELRLTGGGAKSRVWSQIKADILGRSISTLYVSEATSLGTAILAGVALGEYSSVEEAADRLVRVKETFEPNPKLHEVYAERSELYKEVYPRLKDILHKV
ncbi:MAG TPA: hypothetical protein EYP61_01905 [Candidatus Latescibacteria bacterium]|nr:hypothetical protein [Candidatus Latescibacterota bacterium]